jgi:GxxExxY protein
VYSKLRPLLGPEQEAIVTQCIEVGLAVHRDLGPGFRKRIHQRAYCLELDARGVAFEAEKRIEVRYKTWRIPGQTVDLVVAGVVLVEFKSVPRLRPLHEAQVRSYLKTIGLRVGLLMNFNVRLFKEGLKRIVF